MNLNLGPLRLAVTERCVMRESHIPLGRVALFYLSVESMSATTRAIFLNFQSLGVTPSVLGSSIRSLLALGAGEMNYNSRFSFFGHIYSMMRLKVPAPTVLPPSRMAKRSPFSKATWEISFIFTVTLSPGMTISTPSGNSMVPVTSVVLI